MKIEKKKKRQILKVPIQVPSKGQGISAPQVQADVVSCISPGRVF